MYLVPADDLPVAMVGAYRVAFTRNGAFVVSRDGRWIFDGGLHYATTGLSEWGTQIRRSGAKDIWRLDEKDDRLLVTDGTLCDSNGTARFTFTQRTKIIPGGLSFFYEVTPLEKRPLQEFGIALHLPAAEAGGVWASFWPGFLGASLPRRFDPSVLQEATGRASVLYVSNEIRGAVVGRCSLAWKLGDSREPEANAYRLIGRDTALVAPLGEGKTVTFSFDILLGNAAARTISLEDGYCDVDRYGRLVVRSSTDKLIEGGLMLFGPSVRWLCVRSEPGYDGQQASNEWAAAAWGNADVDPNKYAYEVKLSAPEQGAVVVYRARPTQAGNAGDATANIQVGFAVLKSTGGAPPALDAPGNSGADPAAQTPRIYRARLACADDTTVELGSDNPWSLAETKCGGVDCFLLSTNMRKTEGGIHEARIQVSAHQTRSSVEK
jgi:hypothetical protein